MNSQGFFMTSSPYAPRSVKTSNASATPWAARTGLKAAQCPMFGEFVELDTRKHVEVDDF